MPTLTEHMQYMEAALSAKKNAAINAATSEQRLQILDTPIEYFWPAAETEHVQQATETAA